MKKENKKDILQGQEIKCDLTCKDEINVQEVQVKKETKDIKNNKKDKFNKRIIVISSSIVAVLLVIIGVIIAQLKYSVITNVVQAFKERHRFTIETENESIYVGLGEEVTLSTSTKLFQKKVDDFEIVSNNEEILSVNDNIIKGENVGKAILYGKSGQRESYPINLECIDRKSVV